MVVRGLGGHEGFQNGHSVSSIEPDIQIRWRRRGRSKDYKIQLNLIYIIKGGCDGPVAVRPFLTTAMHSKLPCSFRYRPLNLLQSAQESHDFFSDAPLDFSVDAGGSNRKDVSVRIYDDPVHCCILL